MIAYFFSNAGLFSKLARQSWSPRYSLILNLMVMLSLMQPNPSPDNPPIYTEQQRQRGQDSSNV